LLRHKAQEKQVLWDLYQIS